MDAILELKKQIEDNNLKEGNYVILVYEIHEQSFIPDRQRMFARFMFKNFDDFESKIEECTKLINDDYGIYYEWRTFD